ncbi:MAG: alanine racemase [Candidatus Liptonbacteria bacterium]|nr:alanine racemase [Candidatus Liptonbacteria bacterium]
MDTQGLRTWIEIDTRAAKQNYQAFRKLIKPRVKLWAVVKSNAYGHNLVLFSKLMATFGVDGLCVDSIVEANRLREEGIEKPILVLGPTLPARLKDAVKNNITLSVSNFEALKALAESKEKPEFHLKIDTGFHRQGFYLEDVPKVIKIISNSKLEIRNCFRGVFTHLAAAKDVTYPLYTERQIENFKKALNLFTTGGYPHLLAHAAATGGTSLSPKYHFDAVRVGMGLYGFHASPELEMQLPQVELAPVLQWKTVISEVKKFEEGDYIGYDITERMRYPGKLAILPIGYWHGFPRALSSVGSVLIKGKFAKVLGRVSMDMTAVDVTEITCRPGDIVTLLGREKGKEIRAQEVGRTIGTTQYELLTRLNPLMERILV